MRICEWNCGLSADRTLPIRRSVKGPGDRRDLTPGIQLRATYPLQLWYDRAPGRRRWTIYAPMSVYLSIRVSAIRRLPGGHVTPARGKGRTSVVVSIQQR